MKKLSAVLFVLFVLLSGNAFASGGKTAIVDTQAVFDKTKLGKKYQGVIKEYYESRKKILDMDYEELQKLQEDLKKQASVLNEKARKEKEDTIGRKVNDFEKKRAEFSTDIDKKREELSADFNQALTAVLKEVAKREKASVILNKAIDVMGKTEVPSVLYADEDLDLTEKVIAEMDKRQDAAKEGK